MQIHELNESFTDVLKGAAGKVKQAVSSAGERAIDAAAAAKHPAARVSKLPAIEPGVRLGAVQPIGARVPDAIQITHRDMDPMVVVRSTRLNQQHTLGGIGAETIG